jgi:hypothetical protein
VSSGAGGGGAGSGAVLGQEGLELDLGRRAAAPAGRDHDLGTSWSALRQRAGQHRQQRSRNQHRLRAAVREHVGIVVGGQQRVDGHRHDAGVHRAEEGHRPVGAVQHQQQHPLLAPHAGRRAAGGHAANPLVELAVTQRALVVDEGDLGGAAALLQQVLGEVEALRGRRTRTRSWWRWASACGRCARAAA